MRHQHRRTSKLFGTTESYDLTHHAQQPDALGEFTHRRTCRVDSPNFISTAFWRRSWARQAAKRVHCGASGRHTHRCRHDIQSMTQSPTPNRRSSSAALCPNGLPNFAQFGVFQRVGGPGRRARLLPRYPMGCVSWSTPWRG